MIGFLFNWVCFLIFLVSFLFSEKVSNSQFDDRFSLFLGPFPLFFGSVSSFFGFVSGFQKVVNSQFVDWFPRFLGPFPLLLGQFPIFRKSCKFSICWLVSSFFGSVSSFLGNFQDVYQIIGFSWVWFAFSTHFWHFQTPP